MKSMPESTQITLRTVLSRLWLVAAFAVLALSPLVAGCRNEPGSPATRPEAEAGSSPVMLRLVSLSPAISRTLADFGLQGRLVGRTPHCESVDPAIPIVGDLFNLDYERLIEVKPTHILVQPPAGGIDEHLTALAKERGWSISEWRLNNRDEIETLVRDLPGVLFADGSPDREHAVKRSAELLNDIAAALSPGPDPLFAGRTLIVNGVSPVLAFGSGTYLNDVLVALGATNAVSSKGWVQLSLEDVTRLNPQAIIIVHRSSAEETLNEVAGPLGKLDVEATRNRAVGVLNHPDALLPCSGVVGVAREMRSLLKAFQATSP
jgi:ABC-type hemin transport system substrate-binding protein